MKLKNMQLSHRIDFFASIVRKTKCTDFNHSLIDLELTIAQLIENLIQTRNQKSTLYIVGNGGSAAVASHALVDFINVGKINARVLHEPSLITCFANDFGYENIYSRILLQCIKPEDILIAISSSGQSANICNAAKAAKTRNAHVVTMSGFDAKNPLRSLGDINFWLDSDDYGFIEVGHQFILHNLSDRLHIE